MREGDCQGCHVAMDEETLGGSSSGKGKAMVSCKALGSGRGRVVDGAAPGKCICILRPIGEKRGFPRVSRLWPGRVVG